MSVLVERPSLDPIATSREGRSVLCLPSTLSSPKLTFRQRRGVFPYYAGFSEQFATEILGVLGCDSRTTVLDPWNGSGTTTAAAARLGCISRGLDLNPVMVIAARARVASAIGIKPVWSPERLAANIRADMQPGDLLSAWFSPVSVRRLRALMLDLIPTGMLSVEALNGSESVSIIALFRTLRKSMLGFDTTNPVWTKSADGPDAKISIDWRTFSRRFRDEFSTITDHLWSGDQIPAVNVGIGDSRSLPFAAASIDVVLSSPPYCTRLDYAVATRVELALLEPYLTTKYRTLRERLMGTTTVPSESRPRDSRWGVTCNALLDYISQHDSKASSTYYLKSHIQYFESLFRSLQEISRVLCQGGRAVLVAQDSFYKEMRNDLPAIISQMFSALGLVEHKRYEFRSMQTMQRRNAYNKKHRRKDVPVETVLVFSNTNNNQ